MVDWNKVAEILARISIYEGPQDQRPLPHSHQHCTCCEDIKFLLAQLVDVQYEADKMRDCVKLGNESCERRGRKIAELEERIRDFGLIKGE